MRESSKKIKVMNLIVHLGAGGAQELLVNYSRYFANDDQIDYWIFVLEGPRISKYEEIRKNENLKIVYLNAPTELKAKSNFGLVIRKVIGSFYLFKAICIFKPDIIHTHLTKLFESSYIPLLFFSHRLSFHTLHSDPERYTGVDLILAKSAFNQLHVKPICINNKQFEAAKKHYHIKTADIIYNSIDFEYIQKKHLDKKAAREKMGIPNSAYVIGAVGRLNDIKNYQFMIEIFEHISNRVKEAILLVAGSGDSSKLNSIVNNKKLNNKIIFLGEVYNTTLIYSSLDVYISTSIYESCSLTTLEAQALDIKCFVSSSIPSETLYTNNVKRIDIHESAEEWARQILNCKIYDKPVMKKETYSIKENGKKLKQLYINSLFS